MKSPEFYHIDCAKIGNLPIDHPDICIRIQIESESHRDVMLYTIDSDSKIYRGYLTDTLDEVTVTGHWDGLFSNSSAYFLTSNVDILPNQKRFQRNKNGTTSSINYHQNVDQIEYESDTNSSFAQSTSGNDTSNSLQPTIDSNHCHLRDGI